MWGKHKTSLGVGMWLPVSQLRKALTEHAGARRLVVCCGNVSSVWLGSRANGRGPSLRLSSSPGVWPLNDSQIKYDQMFFERIQPEPNWATAWTPGFCNSNCHFWAGGDVKKPQTKSVTRSQTSVTPALRYLCLLLVKKLWIIGKSGGALWVSVAAHKNWSIENTVNLGS